MISPFTPTGQDVALAEALAAPAPNGAPPVTTGEAKPPSLVGGLVGGGATPAGATDGPAPPAMLAAVAPAPSAPAAGSAQAQEVDELAASPWNTANNPGLNRDLLPSAMAARASEPPPPAAHAAARPDAAGEGPSRTPWIIVGVLVLVAVVSGVAVFLIRAKAGSDGQIAIPAGARTAAEDTPTEAAPTTSATAAPVATHRPVAPAYRPPPVARPRPQGGGDDPYSDVPTTPSYRSPGQAKNRVFGSEN